GTDQEEACELIRAAKLRCELVEIGGGGRRGTVRDTDPPGGYKLPEGRVVRVRVYGAITVPNVVGLRVDRACEVIESTAPGSGESATPMSCEREATPEAAPS